MRKRLLQYDDVLNRQREVVYGLRNDAIRRHRPARHGVRGGGGGIAPARRSPSPDGRPPEPEPLNTFLNWINLRFPLSLKPEDAKGKAAVPMVAWIMENLRKAYLQRLEFETPEAMAAIERYIVIRAIDRNWQDHLTEIEDLRKSVGLRGYGQRDPLNEYKSEAFTYFEQMMGRIRADVCGGLFTSATNLQSFQSLLQLMQRRPRHGPNGSDAAGGRAAAPADQRHRDPRQPLRRPRARPRPPVARRSPNCRRSPRGRPPPLISAATTW